VSANGHDSNGRQRLAAISNALVRLHARHFGKGPNRARTFALEDFVLCLLQDPFITAELTLIANGEEAAVRHNRLLFYASAEQHFREAVRHITGREVLAVLPQISADPAVISLLFLLAPEQ
jgi:uncharacterized protein YbcI